MPSDRLCWERIRAIEVMNTSAEDVPDEVFLAVHSEYPLPLLDTNTGRYQHSIAARELLSRFLDPAQHHMQVVVQGASGSGKSHLIKWMSLTIPRQDDRVVITIPKAGMNLRRIIELIIRELPPDEQHRYRARLEQAGDEGATKEQKRWNLLGALANAIKSDPRAANVANEREDWLIQALPNIFLDPQLRLVLDRREGVIGELIEHIFDTPHEYRRRETQRLFELEDLPLDLSSIQLMAQPTRDILVPLANMPGLGAQSLEIINRNLDRAIARVLNLSADQLISLMLELRTYLRQQGRSLVLLIEDFARLQGIDGAMLQALIEVGTPQNGLCELRWVMAVTTGYYQQVANTVQTRMNYLVEMDLPTGGDDRVIGDEEIITFAARYLNASRLSREALLQWKAHRGGQSEDAPVPNACTTCAKQQSCHAVFGEQHGIGLYPFTRQAVLNMAHRRDPKLSERFNPRILVKDVLLPVTGVYGPKLEDGHFPPPVLLEEMGGSRLPTAKNDLLRQGNPHHDRHRVVLELWSSSPGRPERLPEGLYAAFSLPPAPDIGFVNQPPATGRQDGKKGGNSVTDQRIDEVTISNENEETGKSNRSERERAQRADERIEGIRAWGRVEAKLSESLVGMLRDLVWANLDGHVDWDAAGLHKSDLVKRIPPAYFSSRYIVFRDAVIDTQVPPGRISLQIPLTDGEQERLDTALALEGLLTFHREGTWEFEYGATMLGAFAECLSRWAAQLTDSLRTVPAPDGQWDPIPSAVEILTVGAALAGKLSKPGESTAEKLNAIFEPWPAPSALQHQSEAWVKLYGEIHSAQPALKEIIRTWGSAVKGGKAGKIMDASRVLPAFVQMQHSWSPAANPPQGAAARKGEVYGKLGTVYSLVRKSLDEVARAEWHRRVTWLEQVRQRVPESVSWSEALKSLDELELAMTEYGLGCRKDIAERFRQELEASRGLVVDVALAGVMPLVQEESPLAHLPVLGATGVGAIITQTNRLFTAVDQFLHEVEAKLTGAEAAMQGVGEGLKEDRLRLETSLRELSEALAVIGGNHAD